MGVFNPLALLAGSFFAGGGPRTSRGSIPLSAFGLLSSELATAWLPSLLATVATPNFAPPNWWPILPFNIQNTGDPTSWVGERGQKPIDPNNDPFYHPDESRYVNLNNGDIIDIREVGLSIIWQNIDHAYQISYRTENTFGSPKADVTTVMIPNNHRGQVVSYQMWEDANNLKCSPSYSLATGISDPTYLLLLLAGFIVNTPDHEGVDSAFVAGIREGKSTLNSLRAFLNARERIGLENDSNDKIIMWGYSGGTIASGHAAEILPNYAPDLQENIIATVLGGVVVNFTDFVEAINGGIFAGFIFAGWYGLSSEYPEVKSTLDGLIRPGIRWRYESVSNVCTITHLVNYLFNDFWSYTSDKSNDLFYDSEIQEIIYNETLGVPTDIHGIPPMPMMIYNSVQDQICRIGEVDRIVEYYCENNVNVDYYRFSGLAHITAELVGIPEGLKWIIEFFKGYRPAGCSSWQEATKKTVSTFGSDQSKLTNIANGKFADADVLSYCGISS